MDSIECKFCSHCLLVTIVRNHLHYYYISVIAVTALLVWREEGYDLLDNLRRAVQINDALVDTHLVAVPGLGAFTAGGFAGGDAQNLGGHAHRSLDLQLLVLCALDQVCAHCTHIQHCEYRPTLNTHIQHCEYRPTLYTDIQHCEYRPTLYTHTFITPATLSLHECKISYS